MLAQRRPLQASELSRERAAEAFNISATPTFFINGRKLRGELAIVDFDKVIDLLAH